MRALHALGLVLVLATTAVAEDTIRLKSGRTLRGTILQTGETVVKIRTPGGVEWVKRSDIDVMSQVAEKKKKTDTAREQVRPPTSRSQPRPTEAKTSTPVPTPMPAETAEAAGSMPARTKTSATDAAAPDSEMLAKVLAEMGAKEREPRIAATTWIVENWPTSARVLDSALLSKNDVVRVEAARLLDDDRLGDTSRRLARALDDASVQVRIAALRAVRHRGYDAYERRALQIMQDDPEWVVRQEAIRTLEEIGSHASLRPVVAAWAQEADPDRKRRYRRVLRAVLLEDFGDEVDDWRRALDEVHVGRRKVRGD